MLHDKLIIVINFYCHLNSYCSAPCQGTLFLMHPFVTINVCLYTVTKPKVVKFKKFEIQQTYPLRFLTPLSMSCNCILSHVLHCVPWRPRGTSGTRGRCISSNVLSQSDSPVTHLTTVRSSSSLVVPCDISGSSNFFVIA